MERHGCRNMAWKKKLCTVLAISLLTGGVCFVQGKIALPIQAEDGRRSAKLKNMKSEIATSSISNKKDTYSENIKADIATSSISKKEIHSKSMKANIATLSNAKGIMCLQIPEKLEVIIDPWEINENGQIYAEPFTIKNTGDVPGVLTLSFTCKMNKKDGVMIKETSERLHDSNKKLIYMTVALGDGEKSAFTEEGAQCQAELQPGAEMSLRFEGEVNENTKEEWKNGDIEFQGRYSWEEENIFEIEKEDLGKDEIPLVKTEKKISGEDISPVEIEKVISREEEFPSAEPEENLADIEESLSDETEREKQTKEENRPEEE